MQIRINATSAVASKAPLLAVPVTDLSARDPLIKALDRTLKGRLRKMARAEGFTAKAGSVLSLTGAGSLGANRLMLLGLGKDVAEKPAYRLRTAAAQAGRWARGRGLKRIGLVVPAVAGIEPDVVMGWLAEGVLLGSYAFSLKTGDRAPKPEPDACTLILPTDGLRQRPKVTSGMRAAAEAATANAGGVSLARDLVNAPANDLSPVALAEQAKELAGRRGLKAKVLGLKEIERRGMRLLAAVGRGSLNEPRFVHLHYRPAGQRRASLALVGKGITFDSGGLSLKPPAAQPDMKCDMAGAAVVLGTLEAAAARNLPVELHGVIPTCENMPGGKAYRPGDVLGSLDGKTVEINNTDAEGRLILADALAYARTLNTDAIFDFATLTGACVVALGPVTAGLFASHDRWAEDVLAASERAGEHLWRLPLTKPLKQQLKSPVADLKNTGSRWGGAITAALFLQEFAGDGPWVHMDIAGPAFLDKIHGFHPKGGTGFGVLSMLELIASRVE